METQVIRLFPPDYLERLERGNRLRKRLLLALCGAALAACVTLCVLTNTRNSTAMMLWTMGISTVTGWIVIYQSVFHVRQAAREISHAHNLEPAEEWEPITGTVEVTNQRFRIRNAVNMQRVRITTPAGERTLNVCASRGEVLRRAGRQLTLYVSHGYVAGYEVAP